MSKWRRRKPRQSCCTARGPLADDVADEKTFTAQTVMGRHAIKQNAAFQTARHAS